MANENNKLSSVKVSDIIAIPSLNVSRTHGAAYDTDGKILAPVQKLVTSMAMAGFDPLFPLRVEPIPAYAQDVAIEHLTREMQRLEDLDDGFKQKFKVSLGGGENDTDIEISLTKEVMLAHFKATYCDSKGNPKLPKYWVIAGHMRAAAVMLTNAIASNTATITPIATVPCLITDYEALGGEPAKAKALRHSACIDENLKKTVGHRALDWVDLWHVARVMRQDGATQKDIRAAFGDGNGQKIVALLDLADSLSGKAIGMEQLLLNDKTIDIKSLDKERARQMKGRPAVPAKGNKPAVAAIPPATPDELLAWLRNPKQKQAKNSVSFSELDDLATQFSGCATVAQVITAIREQDTDKLRALLQVREPLDAISVPILLKLDEKRRTVEQPEPSEDDLL